MSRLSARPVALLASVLLLGTLGVVGVVPGARAATRVVTNCNNGGTGSLRSVAAVALSGDTIDLSRLSCTRITLASEIPLPQANLLLLGRDQLAMTLHGNRVTRVLHHTGTGTLELRRLSVSYGFVAGLEQAFGGCIESTGNVTLRQSRAHHCMVDANVGAVPVSKGGAIHADGFVLLDHSAVFENDAVAIAESQGGGVASGGKTTLLYSHVYNNSADSGGGVLTEHGFRMVYSLLQGNLANEQGGGANIRGDAEVNKSTISGNHADSGAGAMTFGDADSQSVAVIAESTISGNSSGDIAGGIAFVSADGEIYNSTITQNHEGATLACYGAVFNFGMRMESTVVAGNTCDGDGPPDVGTLPGRTAIVTGSHNLVGSSRASMPPDTIFSSTPGLGALQFNGGPTRTHAVLAGSPLIDAGSNPLNRSFDQRGAPFARVRGAAPDIGAFER